MTAREEKLIKRNSIIDWSAYAVIIGLMVGMYANIQGHGMTLAGMEAWIRVAANTIHIPYGN